ncbi:uncharacterized protein YukE [Streptomyces sp. V4I23]|uniref:hypothetical protein n=1 Tax=Streptomyces sp. V4I23 TaxID=3042282 RepID=UPI0027820C31|nr:hypothetical protein [Streptomyces sp. V4I23]MDQ1005804.1 uncharacterized protein YukE [Streptomyces sp. V4I23]MDQ1005952.1 uncharacterized protein YukE [Streptomyces sp. V4I23]
MAMRQSEEAATRSGIMALEQAYSGVLKCQQDVQSTRGNLASGYGGADGGRYGQLLDQWDGQVDIILTNLDRMVDELNNTLREHGLAQGSANEAIDREHTRSTRVFDELNPGAAHSS